MNLILQIICIVLVFHSVKAATVGYTLKTDTDCFGNAIGSPFTATVSSCIAACGSGPCVAVIYNPTSGLCWMKSRCDFTPHNGYNLYYKDIVPGYTLTPNADCLGNEMSGQTPATLDECIASCAAGPCVAVLYDPTYSQCWAKSVCNNFIPTNGFNVYHKDIVPGYTLTPNVDCAGNDIMLGIAATLAECIASCAASGSCVAVLHNPNTVRCWTKSLCDNFTPLNGYHVYHQDADFVPGYTLTPNSDCAGHDINDNFEATLDQCIAACDAGSCVAVLYNNAISKCWTKSLCDNFTPLNGYNVYHKEIVPGYTLTPNSDCSGNDIYSLSATLAECIGVCAAGSCVAVLYDVTNSQCWTKTLCDNITPQNGINMYHKDIVPGYTLTPNSECPGSTLAWEFPLTLDECIAACDYQCVAVCYSRYTGACYIQWWCADFSPIAGYDVYSKD